MDRLIRQYKESNGLKEEGNDQDDLWAGSKVGSAEKMESQDYHPGISKSPWSASQMVMSTISASLGLWFIIIFSIDLLYLH